MPQQAAKRRDFPTAEQIVELTEAVTTLTDQVRCLRLAVDEIEAELGWAIRTKVLDQPPRPTLPCDTSLLDTPFHEDQRRLEHAMQGEAEVEVEVEEDLGCPPRANDAAAASKHLLPRTQSRLW